jgi:hypothetical protein
MPEFAQVWQNDYLNGEGIGGLAPKPNDESFVAEGNRSR